MIELPTTAATPELPATASPRARSRGDFGSVLEASSRQPEVARDGRPAATPPAGHAEGATTETPSVATDASAAASASASAAQVDRAPVGADAPDLSAPPAAGRAQPLPTAGRSDGPGHRFAVGWALRQLREEPGRPPWALGGREVEVAEAAEPTAPAETEDTGPELSTEDDPTAEAVAASLATGATVDPVAVLDDTAASPEVASSDGRPEAASPLTVPAPSTTASAASPEAAAGATAAVPEPVRDGGEDDLTNAPVASTATAAAGPETPIDPPVASSTDELTPPSTTVVSAEPAMAAPAASSTAAIGPDGSPVVPGAAVDAAPVDAPDLDVTASADRGLHADTPSPVARPTGPVAEVARAEPSSAAANVARIVEAVDRLRSGPPPREVVLDLRDAGGADVEVHLRVVRGEVHVTVRGEGVHGAWRNDLEVALGERGMSLGSFDLGERGGARSEGAASEEPGRGRGRPPAHANASPTATTRPHVAAARAAAGLRL